MKPRGSLPTSTRCLWCYFTLKLKLPKYLSHLHVNHSRWRVQAGVNSCERIYDVSSCCILGWGVCWNWAFHTFKLFPVSWPKHYLMQLRSSFPSFDTLFLLGEHVELFERGLELLRMFLGSTLKHCKLIDGFCTNIPVHGLLHPLHVHCCFLCSALLFTFILLLRTGPMSPSRLGKHSTSK